MTHEPTAGASIYTLTSLSLDRAVLKGRARIYTESLLFFLSRCVVAAPKSLTSTLAEAGEGTLSLEKLRAFMADAFAWRESRLQA